jgi:asparaginyl-tRNA synthetase
MKKVYAVDLLNSTPDGTQVELYGWVKTIRGQSKIVFLNVCDSTGMIQCVVSKNNEELFKLAMHLNQETAVKIVGTLVKTGRANPQKEICVQEIEIIGISTISVSPYPRSGIDILDPKLQEQLLDKRYFYLRNEKIAAILKFRHVLTRIVHQWFDEQGFIEIHAPVLTPTPLYDDRSAMAIQVHGQDVYLTQCVGFYLEQAVHAFEKIYNIGPSFRAEESRSKRHLMEYWHIKAELAFVDFEDLVTIVEQFIHGSKSRLLAISLLIGEIIEIEADGAITLISSPFCNFLG